MNEPVVTLTDFGIALECAIFCALTLRWHSPSPGAGSLRLWWAALFASIGVGALLGGIVHGFAPPAGAVRVALWRATLLSLGVTAAAMWNLGARLALREPAVTWVRRAAIGQVVAYAAIVLFFFDRFIIAIATYLPAALFLAIAIGAAYRRTPARALAQGLAGVGLSFVAAAIQQLRVAIHPTWFDHNALYHLVQAVALYLLFLAARWSITTPRAAGGST